ncbi:MAG TPA: hypothetical protein GX530_03125 [Corynebacteriales bacterium]|nr:hypothetical protein [Mycobacteriales bacterium]
MKFTVVLEGVDGSEWVLSGAGFGAVTLMKDNPPAGLWDAPAQTKYDQSARQEGGTFRSLRWDMRDITLPVDVDGDRAGKPWEVLDDEFRRAFSYTKDAKLKITTEYGGERWIKVRMWQTPEVITTEGQLYGHGQVAYYLRASDPFYHTTIPGDEFVFDGRNYVGTLTVENPSDHPMYLRYAVRGSASVMLPDVNLEGSKDRHKMIVLPFQGVGQDVAVSTRPDEEQVVCIDHANWWARMSGQLFWYAIPPWTPPTEIPVAINPLPWVPNLLSALSLPINMPNRFLYRTAEVLTQALADIPQDTVLSWTPEDLATRINDAFGVTKPEFEGKLPVGVEENITIPHIGQLITKAYGSVATMAGAGVKVYMEPSWSRPFGMMRND